jgi:hypothetical protein
VQLSNAITTNCGGRAVSARAGAASAQAISPAIAGSNFFAINVAPSIPRSSDEALL